MGCFLSIQSKDQENINALCRKLSKSVCYAEKLKLNWVLFANSFDANQWAAYEWLKSQECDFLNSKLFLSNELFVLSGQYRDALDSQVREIKEILGQLSTYYNNVVKYELMALKESEKGRIHCSDTRDAMLEMLSSQKMLVKSKMSCLEKNIKDLLHSYAEFWRRWGDLLVEAEIVSANLSISKEHSIMLSTWKKKVDYSIKIWCQVNDTEFKLASCLAQCFEISKDVLDTSLPTMISEWRDSINPRVVDNSECNEPFYKPLMILKSILASMEAYQKSLRNYDNELRRYSKDASKTAKLNFQKSFLEKEAERFKNTRFKQFTDESFQLLQVGAINRSKIYRDLTRDEPVANPGSFQNMNQSFYRKDSGKDLDIGLPKPPNDPMEKQFVRQNIRNNESILLPTAPCISHMKPAPPIPLRKQSIR